MRGHRKKSGVGSQKSRDRSQKQILRCAQDDKGGSHESGVSDSFTAWPWPNLRVSQSSRSARSVVAEDFSLARSAVAPLGARLSVHLRLGARMNLPFRPTGTRAEPKRELRWSACRPRPWLFCAEHSFTLEVLDGTRVRLDQREVLTGLLALPILLVTKGRIRRVFADLNTAAELRAERLSIAKAPLTEAN